MAVSEKTADPTQRDEGFTVPLCLWQRAAFLAPAPGPSTSGSNAGGGGSTRGERDSLRLRIAQLRHEYWREVSRGFQPLHVERLVHSLTESYCTAMDSSDGVESIAAPVKVLTASRKKESGQWKSEISLETLLSMPGVRTTDRDKSVDDLPLETVPVAVLDSVVSTGHQRAAVKTGDPITQPSASVTPIPPLPQSHSLVQPPQHHTQQPPCGANRAAGKFPYSAPYNTCGKVGNGKGKERARREEEEEEEDDESTDSRWGSGRGGYRGRRRRAGKGGWGARKKARRDEDNEEEEVEEPRHAPSTFLTARDQHVLNQQKKYGGRASEGSRGTQPQANSYGCSKKSLGTRRVPGNRFVPPVRRDEGEGGGAASSCLDAVRSRVQYGGGPNSSSTGDRGGGGLPPELEGDERLKNIEPRMVELIMNEIMDHGAPVQWDDIAGLQFAKATIKEIVVWPMLRPDIFTGLRGPPKGILLFGPPGTGKTLIGKCIASQVNATFFSISASSLTSKWIGEGEKMVRALFAVARCYQPAVIFMDEIDSLLSQRSESEHESSRRIKTEFLVQLDGATTSADDRILIIGATNRPQEIDEAARRRLVKRLYIPLPDGSARKQIVSNLLREQAYSMTSEELEELSTTTDGYSGADMANLCREAAYGPVREAAETIQHISADEMRPVLYQDFEAALHVIRPSVSERDLDLYVQWNKQFGCGKH